VDEEQECWLEPKPLCLSSRGGTHGLAWPGQSTAPTWSSMTSKKRDSTERPLGKCLWQAGRRKGQHRVRERIRPMELGMAELSNRL